MKWLQPLIPSRHSEFLNIDDLRCLQKSFVGGEAIARRLEAIATRLEAIATRLEAIAIRYFFHVFFTPGEAALG